ncbi:hypothetical protein OG500_27030 [Kitasatospora sp. NBC_01250]|uniref:hypothetical protein n=1 Tax=Kitasatospora sp. NBC_01250 TaxID=2903571 RepID=UPI002E35B0C2|nr:hypothetical protein [Kitasatospora sp. NBC_01250]
MALLTAAVVLVGLLGVLNLVLTYGVIRRLRTQPPAGASGQRPPIDAASVGTTAQPFSVVTADGSELSREGLEPGTVVGFFAPGCEPCAELLPRFVESVRRAGLPVERVLAVIADGLGKSDYANALAPVARLVVDREAAKLVTAFAVTGMPVVCQVGSDGDLTVLTRELTELGRPVAA